MTVWLIRMSLAAWQGRLNELLTAPTVIEPRLIPCSGFVLFHHCCRDPPAGADRDAMVFRPGPDVTTAPTA